MLKKFNNLSKIKKGENKYKPLLIHPDHPDLSHILYPLNRQGVLMTPSLSNTLLIHIKKKGKTNINPC
jgi:hypothetical protein